MEATQILKFPFYNKSFKNKGLINRSGTTFFGIIFLIIILSVMYPRMFVSLFHFSLNSFLISNIIERIIDYYRTWIASISVQIFHLFDISVYYNSLNKILVFNTYHYKISDHFGMFKNVYFLLLLIPFPFPLRKSLSVLIIGLFGISLFLAIRLAFLSCGLFNESNAMTTIDYMYVLFLISFFYYKVKISYSLRRSYVIIQNKLKERAFTCSIKTLIISIISFGLLSNLILYSSGSFITHLLLLLTKQVMAFYGFITLINNNIIYLGSNFVFVGSPCLGIQLMLMFALVIIFLKGTIKSKIVFILLGVVMIFLINVLRISYILYHLHHYKNKGFTIEVHDMYDYAVYALTISLWLVYAKWQKNHIV